jgi:DNA-binding SARP family transcriptional activator
MATRFTRVQENIANLQRALSLFSEQENLRGQFLSQAFLIEALTVRGNDPIPIGLVLEQADLLLQSSKADLYPYERAILWCQMGFGMTVRGGNPRKGYWACQNAYLISKELGDLLLQTNALVNSVQSLNWLGEFVLADEKCNELEKLVAKHPSSGVRLLYHIARCESYLFQGDLEKAGELIQLAQREAERHGLTYLYPVTLLYDLFLKSNLQQYREARETGKRLLSLASATGNSFISGLTRLYMGRSLYFEGRYQEAQDFLKRAGDIFYAVGTRSDYHISLIRVLEAFIACHLQKGLHLKQELQQALDHFTRLSSFVAIDAHFALALLEQSRAKTDKAVTHLAQGFGFAMDKGYDHFTMTSPRDLLTICMLALELEVEGAMDYAAHLLSTRLASLAQPELERLALYPCSKMREKAAAIRQTIHRSRVPRLHVKTLGGFRVSRGESAIGEKEWQGSQPKSLLKAIVAQASKGTPKDLLIEMLWPEIETHSGERNFKVTLHRLRRALEPAMDPSLGSSYIHLKDNLLTLDEELFEIDVKRFLSCIDEGQAKEKEGDVTAALSLYAEAIEAYKGDFLPEDLYAPWVESRRLELQRTDVDLLYRVAQIHEGRRALKKAIACYKKAIQADPLLEDAYQRLLVIYAQLGTRNEALKVYQQCKEALRDGLDAEPDPLTVALYQKILE